MVALMRVRMKTYVGRYCKGSHCVYIVGLDGESSFLPGTAGYPRDWGVNNHGSLQLAYDLLFNACGDPNIARAIQRAFQQNYIVPLARTRSWKMTEHAVLNAAVLLTSTSTGEPK